jgi:RNA recognition motif-containing protein
MQFWCIFLSGLKICTFTFIFQEVSGRAIRVEFAKRFRKPPTPPPEGTTISQDRHNVYVSNLAWKARSANLREFFAGFNPVSVRVVFENPSGRSAGYGFVSFSTKDEAEAAIAELDGKVI